MRTILLAALLLLLDASAYAQPCQQWQCTWIQNQQYCTCVYQGPVGSDRPWLDTLDAWSPYRNPYIKPYRNPYQ
jgi:hypothetical protein